MLRIPTGTIDLARATFVADDGRVTRLSSLEAGLLARLAEHPGEDVSRDELLRDVWGHHALSLSRAVDVTVTRLRRKIEPDPANPRCLINVRGFGYKLCSGEE